MNNLSNRVMLIGNLGQDPEMREFENGNKVVRMNLATTEYFKNKAGKTDTRTTWHKIVAWNGQANYANKFLRKGSRIAIEGKLENRSWEDKDKNIHYITEIIVNEIMSFDAKEKDKEN
jgi:single-strand DNA-binding protein